MNWPYRLSAVLSVTTGKLLAPPSDISDLLVFMTGDASVRFDTAAARRLAPVCAAELCHQYPALADVTLPAVPAASSDDTLDQDRPQVLDDWIATIAEILGFSTPDPWVPVCPLPAGDRG